MKNADIPTQVDVQLKGPNADAPIMSANPAHIQEEPKRQQAIVPSTGSSDSSSLSKRGTHASKMRNDEVAVEMAVVPAF